MHSYGREGLHAKTATGQDEEMHMKVGESGVSSD